MSIVVCVRLFSAIIIPFSFPHIWFIAFTINSALLYVADEVRFGSTSDIPPITRRLFVCV